MIGIVDYGLGNIISVLGAIERLGQKSVVTSDPEVLASTEKLILPGVGAFGDGMRNLHERGLVQTLEELVFQEKKPILGICLGAQLFTRHSEEFGSHQGLGWLDAAVKSLKSGDPDLRVPHVGWNELHVHGDSILLTGISPGSLFYYVHSYYIDTNDEDIVVGSCEYGMRFPALLQLGNVYAAQFHPEKSQLHGLAMMRNFLELS